MPSHDLRSEIKALLVAELNLSGRDPATIDDEAPLFGPAPAAPGPVGARSAASEVASREGGTYGLGLDSLDALQIAMLVEERFGVRVPDGDEARPIFRSVSTLAAFIEAERAAGASPVTP